MNKVYQHETGTGAGHVFQPKGYSPTAGEEDTLLLSRVERGDEQAMSTLFDRYSKVVYSVALRVLREPSAAEDVLQEIFMQVWRSPDRFTATRGSLGGWLAIVSRNRSIDALRRKRPTEQVEDAILAGNTNLAEEAERSLMMERARLIIGDLPLEHAQDAGDGLLRWPHAHRNRRDHRRSPWHRQTRIRSAILTLRKAFQA